MRGGAGPPQNQDMAEIECSTKLEPRWRSHFRQKGQIAGFVLGPPVGRAQYSDGEKRALRNCAGQFALMLENARLTDRMVEQEKVNRDVQLAAEVQKRLFRTSRRPLPD